ncbi:hypothetical protein DPMN_159367 [Dreissena polymorpha]|uniref:Uncharacterized protein n=1 Tax=Dreissena polymorpha TaxID=45954 RepID=A0A9D4IMU0_DREPO|nr:hypothetical protein DPMN_159367 [Dreissena polymorpha]
MGRLSKNVQKETLDFSSVQPLVLSTCNSLRDLIEVEGVFTSKLGTFVVEKDGVIIYNRPVKESECDNIKSGINDNYVFEGFEAEDSDVDDEVDSGSFSPEIRYYVQQKNLLDHMAPTYINAIILNLEDRFQDTKVQ